MPATLTKDQIERLAPDQASLGAALKLVKPAKWPVLGAGAGTTLVWGECQGSGATPYRVVADTADLSYKCTCPSRKFPCKHVLALMWQYCDGPQRFAAERGARVGERLAGAAARQVRQRVRRQARMPMAAPARRGRRAAAPSPRPWPKPRRRAPPDPKAAARAEAQRERIRQEREAAILGGLDELDLWIADQLNHGLAGFAANAVKSCRTLSARLVDAKAAGLAGLLDALAADVFRVPEAQRGDLVMERLAAMTVIAAAYRRQDALPPALKADVRRAVGWTVKREDLLADAEALRVAAPWMVVATRSEVQPDKLRRLETWLLRLDTQGADAAAPRFALLLDYIPVSTGAQGTPYTPGEILLAELVFYPSATPLRAHIANREPVPFDPLAEPPPWPRFPAGLGPALDGYDAALALQPWLDAWPLAASEVHLVRGGEWRPACYRRRWRRTAAEARAIGGRAAASGPWTLLPSRGSGTASCSRCSPRETPLGLWYEV